MVTNSPYYKHFKVNAYIYNSSPDYLPTINTLTGQPTKAEKPSIREITNTVAPPISLKGTRWLACVLEFRKPETPVNDKKGINTGDVTMQGRVIYGDNGFELNATNNYQLPSWYRAGGKYLIEAEYYGKGHWYAQEQIKSWFNAEKYFGYPVLGVFLRLNNQE